MTDILSGDELKAALADLGDRTDEEVRELLDRLYDEENELSYRRRVLHGQIDILRAELVSRLKEGSSAAKSLISEHDLDQLTRIIARTLSGKEG